MHSWKALFEQILLSLLQPKGRDDYRLIRESDPSIGRFETIGDLIGFLNNPRTGSREEKDALLASIISCAQSHSNLAATSRDVLLSAMRPALDRVFQSLLPHVPECQDREGRLVNDIFWIFHREIQTWMPETRNRTAATLKLNVLRKVKRIYIEEDRYSRLAAKPIFPVSTPPAPKDSTAKPDEAQIMAAISARYPQIKSADLQLVIGHFVHEKPFSVLAQELEITEENARQRFRRVKNFLQTKKNSRF